MQLRDLQHLSLMLMPFIYFSIVETDVGGQSAKFDWNKNRAGYMIHYNSLVKIFNTSMSFTATIVVNSVRRITIPLPHPPLNVFLFINCRLSIVIAKMMSYKSTPA